MQIWLKFENDTDEEPTHGAHVFQDDDGVRIVWWNEDVGLVFTVHRDTVKDAERWLIGAGYADFTP